MTDDALIAKGRRIGESEKYLPKQPSWPAGNGDAFTGYADDDIPPPPEPPDDDTGEHRQPDDDGDNLEGAIQHRLHVLRVNTEARRRLDDEQHPQAVPPPVRDLDTLLAEPDTPTRYRIAGLAPADSRIILSAQYKAGKTTIVGNLVRALADGDPFLGTFTVNTEARHIVLIDDEMSTNTLRCWLRDQNISHTAAVADVVALRGRVASLNLLDDRCRTQWATRLTDLGADYLILDCLRPVLDALGLSEDHDAGRFLVAYDALLDAAGISETVVVHHMGHANERARGDSRLQDWPDAIWRVVRETEAPDSPRYFSAYGRDVNVAEGRLGFDPATRRLTYAPGSRTDAKTEAAKLAVITLLAGSDKPLSKNEIESALNEHPQKAVRAGWVKAVEDGLVAVDEGPRKSKLSSIANPCAECGLPVITKQQRHLSCPPNAEAALI